MILRPEAPDMKKVRKESVFFGVDGRLIQDDANIMKKLTKDHGIDNSKLQAWKYLTTTIDEGSAGPSLFQRYFYLQAFAKDHHNNSLQSISLRTNSLQSNCLGHIA